MIFLIVCVCIVDVTEDFLCLEHVTQDATCVYLEKVHIMIHVMTEKGSECIFKAEGVTQTYWGVELKQCVQASSLIAS